MGTAGGVNTGSYTPQQLRGVKALEPLRTALDGNALAAGILAALQVDPSLRAPVLELQHICSVCGEASPSTTDAVPQQLRRGTFTIENLASFLEAGGPAPTVKTIQLQCDNHCHCNKNCLAPGHRRHGCDAAVVEAE